MQTPRCLKDFCRLALFMLVGAGLSCSPAGEPGSAADTSSAAAQTSAFPRDRLEGMVLVPAGLFLFGATDEQIDFYLSQSLVNFPGMKETIQASFVTPQQSLQLDSFYIQQFEVSNKDYKEFLEATGHKPSEATNYLRLWQDGRYPEWAATFPVVWVSQQDAAAFCRWRGGRLPNEQEWEKAARGADGRYFPWGNVFPRRSVANFQAEKAEPVGNRPGDISPYNIYDMGGNVAELTSTSVVVQGAEQIVIRGGSYPNQAREMLTVHRDLSADAKTRREDLGFRCILR